MQIELNFHTDSGHGWLEISKDLVKQLNLDFSKVSSFSYQDTNNYYLEEDCDAAILVKQLKEKNIDFNFNEIYIDGNHWIRNL